MPQAVELTLSAYRSLRLCFLSLGLNLVAVRLMFGLESKVFVRRSQEHFAVMEVSLYVSNTKFDLLT